MLITYHIISVIIILIRIIGNTLTTPHILFTNEYKHKSPSPNLLKLTLAAGRENADSESQQR